MTTPATTVYWRPGCGFCAVLFNRLDRAGLSYERVNIWDEPDAAQFVRSVARGHETVPTVTVADTFYVNPTPREILAAVAEVAPADLPEDFEPPKPGLIARLLGA